jgi:hypothetical protein
MAHQLSEEHLPLFLERAEQSGGTPDRRATGGRRWPMFTPRSILHRKSYSQKH